MNLQDQIGYTARVAFDISTQVNKDMIEIRDQLMERKKKEVENLCTHDQEVELKNEHRVLTHILGLYNETD